MENLISGNYVELRSLGWLGYIEFERIEFFYKLVDNPLALANKCRMSFDTIRSFVVGLMKMLHHLHREIFFTNFFQQVPFLCLLEQSLKGFHGQEEEHRGQGVPLSYPYSEGSFFQAAHLTYNKKMLNTTRNLSSFFTFAQSPSVAEYSTYMASSLYQTILRYQT
jgi:hypothetical protein